MKVKINDEVKFKANSLRNGKVVRLPDEDDKLYTVEFESGNTIRCTEHYFHSVVEEVKEDG
jgi:hypothetical protein